jgi:hypothetical protein
MDIRLPGIDGIESECNTVFDRATFPACQSCGGQRV